MPEYLWDYFDEQEVEVDTRLIQPVWTPPHQGIITEDDLWDLDDELAEYDYTRENFDRSQLRQPYHEKAAITLRKYQNEAIEATFSEWMKGNWSTLVVMATATGKTFVIAGVVNRYQEFFGLRKDGSPRRGLILAHRDYLLGQISNALAAFGIDSAIEQGDREARTGMFEDPQVVVASVQSMQHNKKTSRLLSWDPDYFDYIITDEGHHGPAKTYRKIYNHFRFQEGDAHRYPHRLFLTATPKRQDDETLEDLCHSRAFVFDIVDAATYSPPCICTDIKVAYCDTKIDISNIRTTGIDLNQEDIEEAIAPHIEQIARAIKKEIGDRMFIGFWPCVGSSQAMTSALIGLGFSVAHLDAKSKDQDQVLDGFRHGLYQGLNNCAKFGEGFDLPDVSCIILGRPTKSEGLYKQMIGRGIRIKTGKHKDLLIVDFPWVAGKHSLIRPPDIFKGNVRDDEVFNEAAAMLESDGGTEDLLSAITRADRVVKERRDFQVKARDGKVKYTKVEFDPLGIGVTQGDAMPSRESDAALKAPLSEKQVAILRRNGIEGVDSMSRKKASILIGKIFDRMDRGLATFKQVKAMIKKGVDPKVARNVSFEEATAILDKLLRH